ncbi:MAG TPA: flagellar basal-body rod protein FlgF [Stellaceae bacterium]|nr:flagellar basal-body rod protein FlgF [Stellaceae bacterium]
MDTSTYIALSGEAAREQEMAVLANNVANLSTSGFKGERMMFSEYLANAPGGSQIAYVTQAGNNHDMSQGPLKHTGNALDIALNGDGWLAVTTPNGTAYTRSGHFQLDPAGEIVTSEGYQLQNDSGSPLVVPAESGPVSIGADGTVATTDGTVGHISVVNFANPQLMVAEANGLYDTTEAPQPVTTTSIVQGAIEDSNVQPILAMTRLMNAANELRAAKTFSDAENDRLKNAIEQLGKTV